MTWIIVLVFEERDQMSQGQLPRYGAIKIKIDFLPIFFLFGKSVVQYLFLHYIKYYIDLKSINILFLLFSKPTEGIKIL